MYLPKVAPMGWNSWDCYGPSVNEETVRNNAKYMADNLKQYGWEYIVVDIQWSEPNALSHEYNAFADLNMDEYGRLIPAVNRFPSSKDGEGFKPLAEYIHSLGLKFGIHIMRGIPRQAVHKNLPVFGSDLTARQIAKTASICCWNTDMYGLDPKRGGKAYYDSIFYLYASWGVDFIKIDDICRELPKEEEELIMLSKSLEECNRDMVLSLSPGPALIEKAELYKQVSNMWRITDDFWDDWKLLYAMFERAEKWSIHAGYGHFPDADMLPIGPIRLNDSPDEYTRFSKDEQITMMTLWAIMRSPLMIGGEMTRFDEFTKSLITNENLLRMHRQARHSHQVFRRLINGVEHAVWSAGSTGEIQYIAIFNLGEEDSSISLSLKEVEIYSAVNARDLWTGNCFEIKDSIEIDIPKHGATVFELSEI